MNILVINLPRYESIPVVREERCEYLSHTRIDTPATLLIVASLLRNDGHDITFIDANGFDYSYQDVLTQVAGIQFDITVFSFNSCILEHDLRICEVIKRTMPSCLTLGYSWYSRRYSRQILNEFSNLDILITGPCLSVIGDLVKCVGKDRNFDAVKGITFRKDGGVQENKPIDQEASFSDLPLPAYDLLPSFEPYYIMNRRISPYALMYTGKGCPFGCNYCNMARTKHSCRSADKVIEELRILKQLGNVKYAWFFDEVFTLDRDRVIDICEQIGRERIDIKWFCDARVDLVDKELLRMMRKGGCIGISYGIESGSQKILDNMRKGHTVEQARTALRLTREAGIAIQCNLILGYTGEDADTLGETRAFVRTAVPEILQAVTIKPYPGTRYTETERKQKQDAADWRRQIVQDQEPANSELDLNREITDLRRLLYHSPRWWFACMRTAISNPFLIRPGIREFLTGNLLKR